MDTTSTHRTPYPSDVSDDEGAFVAPYLTLMTPDAPQRHYDLREVFNALRWLVRSGAPWRMLPHDFPHWEAVYQQTQHWLQAGCFAAIVEDLRLLLRLAQGRNPQLSAAIFDSRPCRAAPRAGRAPATTGTSGRKDRSSTWQSIPLDTSWPCMSRQPTNRIGPRSVSWRRRSRRPLASTSSWGMSIRGTPARWWRRLPPSMASNSMWSSWRKPSRVSSSCRIVGWPSAPAPGRAASGAWSATTSGCRRRSRACIMLQQIVSLLAGP